MLHEFAVEPDSISDWESCRYVLDQMGVSRARMVAEFPKRKLWKKLVREAARARGCGDREFQRIVQKIETANVKMLPRRRDYDEGIGWIENAISQDSKDPFHAIIVRDDQDGWEKALPVGDLEDTTPLWAVQRERKVVRQAHDIVRYIAPLLAVSREIRFVDPHFDPAKPRWIGTIRETLRIAASPGRTLDSVEVHVLDDDSKPSDREFVRACQGRLRTALPAGVKLRIVRWREKREKFHARYILTNRGGYRFETGLDEGAPTETQDVSVLDAQLHQECWHLFGGSNAGKLEIAGEFWLP